MYIAPETNIRLLSNVPLDKSYEHTIYFDSLQAQYDYFSSLTKFHLTNYSYQRVKRGVCRVGINAENLYDCNYMIFKNTAFGNKWFYAFIDSVEYVNNECTEISFKIDFMQTWFFDYKLGNCFVEREHSETDNIGEHIEAESVSLGEYVMNSYDPVVDMRSMCVILSIVDVDGGSSGTLYDGIYGGSTLWVYDSSDVNGINAKINEYIQKPEAIIGMYICPLLFVGSIPQTHLLSYGQNAKITAREFPAVSSSDTLDGYKPKNKKLYTFPYNYFHVDNASGNSLSLRYEFFYDGIPCVEIRGTVTQPIVGTLRPYNYKGVKRNDPLGGIVTLNTEMLQLNNYPLCSWNYDAFSNWVARNYIPVVLNAVGGSARSRVSGGYSEGTIIGQVTDAISEAYTASINSDVSRGNLNNGNGNVSSEKQQFYCGRCSITAEYARIIDDFFTVYGYAMKRCKVPNRNSRPHWNYVKTVGCVITGSIPADDMRNICEVYDRGITFWKNGSEIGNYSLDNSV